MPATLHASPLTPPLLRPALHEQERLEAARRRREEEEHARRHTRFDDRGRRKTSKRRKKRDDNLVLAVLPEAGKRKGGLSTIMKPSAEALDFASQIMGGSSRGLTRMSRSQFQGQKRLGAPRQFRT